MIATLKATWDLVLYVANTEGVLPVVTSVAFSMAITQRLKRFMPFWWSDRQREIGTQCLAFWSAFIPCYWLWDTNYGLLWGITAGIASPVLWAGIVRTIGWKWPHLRVRFSGDSKDDTDEAGV